MDVENTIPLDLASGSVESMDEFMAEHATDVSLQNIQRIEDKPDDPDVKLCYLAPSDIGPFRSQMRLTIKVEVPKTGMCNINILNMENGTVDKGTGKTTFPEPKDAPPFKFDTENTITWEGAGDGLHVVNTSRSHSETVLPGWFPLPDQLVQVISSAFVKRIITGGQSKVMEQLEQRYSSWLKAQG